MLFIAMNQLRRSLSAISKFPISFGNYQNFSNSALPVFSRSCTQSSDLFWNFPSSRSTQTLFARFNSTETSPSGDKPEDTPKEGGTEVEVQLRSELSKAVSEAATLRAKAADMEDKYKRSLAEMENLRIRMTKQISDGKLYATQGFCKDLTEIEDILQMAISSVPADQVSSNKHLKELYEGLKMTDAQMLQVFKRHGLTQINPLGEKFNPNEHEAVVQQEQEGKASGTVLFVTKIGYKLHDRVIRPAVVGVAK